MTKEQVDLLKGIKNKMRITKVVCTRSVKGKYGDTYVGFSAAWDTVQDDAGGGTDLISDEGTSSGMTMKEARLASLLLAMQADIAATDHAMASGNITVEQREMAVKAAKHNYGKLLTAELGGKAADGTES